MISQELIAFLAHYYGILPGYWDIWGSYHETSMETRVAILNAMGIDASDETRLIREFENILEELRWKVPPVVSIDEGNPLVVCLNCSEELIPQWLDWSIFREDGTLVGEERLYRDDLKISPWPFLEPTGEIPAGLSREVAIWESFENIKECSFALQIALSPGYYKLFLRASDRKSTDESLVIVAPSPSSAFSGLQHEAGIFSPSKAGLSLQLYAVRSNNNWGIGNFKDLKELVSIASSLGAGFVGLNPLHLLFPENPHHISPYSPSSRRFLNPWYVSVEDVPEFEEARKLLPDSMWNQILRCRELKMVDYGTVVPSLYEAFKALFGVFKKRHLDFGTPRALAFKHFCEERGDVLKQYGVFEVLREHFQRPWWEWPHFVPPHAEDPTKGETFFQYLQFIAHEQLSSILNVTPSEARDLPACHPERRGNPLWLPIIGGGHGGTAPTMGTPRNDGKKAPRLYLDLSVSVDAGGFDAWYDRDVYTLGARVGAPPDDFNPRGQEWGVVPMVPHKLKETHYKPFIEPLREVMRYADILRIDHVMGFFRLFWIPEGFSPIHGAYVRYPMDDIARIVALESAINNCVVIGEDLGTVPDEVREEMSKRGFLSYKVFYFEKRHDGSFKSPEEYPERAIATVTTHDLPTFVGYWTERDIDVRAKLGMIDKAFEEKLREERSRDRLKILEALSAEGFECPEHQDVQHNGKIAIKPPSRELVLAVHRYLLRSKAKFAAFQLDDLIGEEDQPNLPGTTTQYPCWRIRLKKSLEEIRANIDDLRAFFLLSSRTQ